MTNNSPVPNFEAQQEISRALAEADQMRRSNRKAEAERICRDILKRHALAVPALNFLALLLSDRGAFDEAETLLRRAISLAPNEPVLFNSLGSLQFRQKDVAAAEASYAKAIMLKPDYAEAHYNHGLMLRELGRKDEALAAQNRAATLRPHYADAIAQIGILQHESGSDTEALASFAAAIALEPNHFNSHYYRGITLEGQGRHDEAIDSLVKACSLRPESYESRYVLGNALNYAGREAEALQMYRQCIELAPEFINAHVDFNSLAWTMGRKDLSFKSFEYARTKVGDRPDLLLAESEQRLRFNEAPAAEDLLRRALERSPERGDLMNALGRALVTQGRMAESFPIFERAIERQPRSVSHYQELAIALLHAREFGKAVDVIQRAIAVSPFEQLSLGLLTLAYRELGDARNGSLVDVSSLVRTYDLPPPAGYTDPATFNRDLTHELGQFHTRQVEPFDQTLRGGTQTMGNLFLQRARNVQLLRQRIDEAVSDYIARMPDDPVHPLFSRKRQSFSYFGSWSCRLRSGGYHTNHVHPQGWISSVYYVSVPDVVSDTHFEQGWLKFGESNLNLGANDRYTDTVRPAVGKLVLFPSYFWHGTIPFASDDKRLTVAFDVVPGGGRSGERISVVQRA